MNSNQPNQLENTTLDRPLKVCILNIDYSKSSSPFKETHLISDPHGYLPSNIPWEWQTVFIDKVNSFSQIQKLKQKFDLFFNFCDGLVHEDRAGEDVIKALEHFQVPFVGSNSHFFGISKQNMKAICSCSDILTAPYQFIMNEDDIETSIKAMKTYPILVKHYNGRGSLGITKDSKVHNEQELRTQIKHMLDEYGGALIEEFIEGREFSVLMFQDHNNPEELVFLNPVELEFKDGETFNHFDQANSSNRQIEVKSVTDKDLIERLYSMSRMAFSEMYGSGFARLDARLNNKGELLFLELEQMPRLFYPSDHMSVADRIISLDKTTTIEKVIDHMVKNAFEICKRKQKPFVILQRDIFGGSGLFAARDLKAGEVILRREERQRFLVSRTYAEKNFKGIRATLFSNYAYPLSDDIFVTWSDIPNEWTPLNHSCEPNLWYPVGEEDLVTRCDVKKGTELTLDYCICYIDKEAQFDCQCGQPTCRGRFTSQDWRKKELIEKYKGHFSLYGEKRIKALLQEEGIPVDPVDLEGRQNKTTRVKITDKCLW